MIKIIKFLLGIKDKPLSPLLPHEIFPEILKWEIGDKLSDNGDKEYSSYSYNGVNEKGTVFYMHDGYGGVAHTCDIKEAKKHLINTSLSNREIKEERQSIVEYSQFIKDFQKAYEESKQ